jgi:hypothetical protein
MAYRCKGCGGGWDYPCECDSNAAEAAEEALQTKLTEGEFDEQIESDSGLDEDEEITDAMREAWFEKNYDTLVDKWVKDAREEMADRKLSALEDRAEMRREEGY